MPEELQTEVLNTVQAVMLKTTPKKKQHKKERRLPRQALQTAEQSGEGKMATQGGPTDGRAKQRRKDAPI